MNNEANIPSSPFFDAVREIQKLQCDLEVLLEISKHRMDQEVYETLVVISERASEAVSRFRPGNYSTEQFLGDG